MTKDTMPGEILCLPTDKLTVATNSYIEPAYTRYIRVDLTPTDAECKEALAAMPSVAYDSNGPYLSSSARNWFLERRETIRRALQRQSIPAQIDKEKIRHQAYEAFSAGIVDCPQCYETGWKDGVDKALSLINSAPSDNSEYERGLEDAAKICQRLSLYEDLQVECANAIRAKKLGAA